ncbi:uncharacterized protein LOC120012495 [Tripterygium wilfordii]|uniref:uncharacterized protein LOC120012495 n=1 Tax=Tripterygium wilfordii TaxID=458696 RepID=UPI0018F850EC|nr:uncharacterized protein LOC120012495 [Tripterygium wilfordii]
MKQLWGTQMKKGTSIREHIMKMMSLLNEFEVLGFDIDGESQKISVSNHYRSLFENFQMNYNMNKLQYSLSKLLNELQAAEGLFKRKTLKVNVTEKDSSIPNGKKKKKTQKKKGKGLAGTGIQSGRVKKPKGKCFHYGQKGHWEKDCPKFLSKNKKGVPGDSEAKISRLVRGRPLGSLEIEQLPVYESCLEGKMTKRAFSAKGYRAEACLDLIHSDLSGPMSVRAGGGFEYFVTFIDDYSRYGYIYLMHHKSETFEKFKEFRAEVEKQQGKCIKTLRSDHGGEYLSGEF